MTYVGNFIPDKIIKAHRRAPKTGRYIRPLEGGLFDKKRTLTDDEAVELINSWGGLPDDRI